MKQLKFLKKVFAFASSLIIILSSFAMFASAEENENTFSFQAKSVNSSWGSVSSSLVTGSYPKGTSVTVTATPIANSGKAFIEWVDASTGAVVSTESKYTTKINKDLLLVATFNTENNDGTGSETAFSLVGGIIDLANCGWRTIRVQLEFADKGITSSLLTSKGSNESVVNTVLKIISPFAYALAALFWLITVMEKSLKYEIFTIKSAATLFGGLIFIGIWITMSAKICMLIVNINADMAGTLLNNTTDVLNMSNVLGNRGDSKSSDLWVIGWLVDFICSFVSLEFFVYIIASVAMLVVAFIVLVKLNIRMIQITCMICVSPVYFGCCVGETTRTFFKNFIVSFISVVVETTYMAIVYIIGLAVWNNSASYNLFSSALSSDLEAGNSAISCGSAIGKLLLCLAIGIMMIKPPKALTSLVGR